MSAFEILCVTMHQRDFSKIQQMNIHSDVFFANQADRTEFEELEFEGHKARMLTTDTRGVGVNRNMCLQYAMGTICILADDDVTYCDNMEEKVLSEFTNHPDADVIVFQFSSDDSSRNTPQYTKTRKWPKIARTPWGAIRLAFRLEAVRRANAWFTTLFGGGCLFPSGEDTMWIKALRKSGLTFYVSKETIGEVSYETSTWFTGYDERYYFGQGALYQALRPKTFFVWMFYSVWRTRGHGELTTREKMNWIRRGREGYRSMQGYQEYVGNNT